MRTRRVQPAGNQLVRRNRRGDLIGGADDGYGCLPSPRRHQRVCAVIRFLALG